MIPGDYWKDQDGVWWIYPPGKDCGIGVLTDHAVTEEADGSITVTPSIEYPGVWHGHLIRGEWQEA